MIEGVARIIGLHGERLAASGFTQGCPVATVALDAASTSEPIRQACDDAFLDWQRMLTSYLSAHGTPDADSMLTVVLAAFEGALLLARTGTTSLHSPRSRPTYAPHWTAEIPLHGERHHRNGPSRWSARSSPQRERPPKQARSTASRTV